MYYLLYCCCKFLLNFDAYKMVQNYAKKCFAENLNLYEVIQSDDYIMSKISQQKLKSIFSYAKHFKNVNFIFRRVFK